MTLQAVERQSDIEEKIVRKQQMHDTCEKWKNFTCHVYVQQDDSGV